MSFTRTWPNARGNPAPAAAPRAAGRRRRSPAVNCRPPGEVAPPLDIGDVLDLALLALAAEPRPPAPRLSVERAAGLLRRMGGPLLSPTLDVVTGRVQRLAELGLVQLADGPAAAGVPAERTLRLTLAGARRLRVLLLTPTPDRGEAPADLAFALKLCLMDRLDAQDRAALLDQAIASRQRDLAAAEYAVRHCLSAGSSTRIWLERQAARLADDIAWLRSLAR
jgi:hypothetical protein